jgi:AcrR family transcriptional regulator
VSDGDPRDRILAVAQRVVLEEGFELATVREIAVRANVNVAAINYYFGSKDELLVEVLAEAMRPYTEARTRGLAELIDRRAPELPALSEVVEALVRPMVELTLDPSGGRPLIRLIQQVRARPREATKRVFVQNVDKAIFTYVDVLQRLLPQLSRADVFWRYNFIIGSVMQILTDADPATFRLKQLSGEICDTDDNEAIIAQLVAFGVGGFEAAAAPTPTA